MEYKLKKDVTINGMEFKAGKVVNVPQSMIDSFEKEWTKSFDKKVNKRYYKKPKEEIKDEINN